MNNAGPKELPCIIPDVTEVRDEVIDSTFTT